MVCYHQNAAAWISLFIGNFKLYRCGSKHSMFECVYGGGGGIFSQDLNVQETQEEVIE